MLNILEPFPLASLGFDSSEKDHLMVEAMRRAFRIAAAISGRYRLRPSSRSPV